MSVATGLSSCAQVARTRKVEDSRDRLRLALFGVVVMLFMTAAPASAITYGRARRRGTSLRRVHDLLRSELARLVQLQRHAPRLDHLPDRGPLHVRDRDRLRERRATAAGPTCGSRSTTPKSSPAGRLEPTSRTRRRSMTRGAPGSRATATSREPRSRTPTTTTSPTSRRTTTSASWCSTSRCR